MGVTTRRRRTGRKMTDEQKQRRAVLGRAWWDSLSPEQQAAHAEGRRAWYANRSPEQIAEAQSKARATLAARLPHRQGLYEQMKAEHPDPQPCVDCGGKGYMQLAFDDDAQTVEFVAWRCYPCRKAQA